MQGWSKGVIYSAVAMLGVGGLLIVLAWNGAANLDYTQGQIPYMISGGLGGLALVLGGLTLIVVHTLRQDLLRATARLDTLIEAVRGSGALGGGPTAVPEAQQQRVVAGRTTYHTPACRLVEGRTDLQVMSEAAARDRGLAACRICAPESAATA
jgi:nitrate reductase gamma subunit